MRYYRYVLLTQIQEYNTYVTSHFSAVWKKLAMELLVSRLITWLLGEKACTAGNVGRSIRVKDEKRDPSMPPSLYGKVPNNFPLRVRKKVFEPGGPSRFCGA